MTWALEELGNYLTDVPDGETKGDGRENWIVSQDRRLRACPELTLVKDGDWSGYDRGPRYKVRRDTKFTSTSLDLQYAKYAIRSRTVLDDVTKLTMQEHKPLMIGIPSPLDLSVFNLGFTAGVRHRRAFIDATAREIMQTNLRIASAIYQLELPVETVSAIKADGLPRSARKLTHRRLASPAHQLVRQTPVGTTWKVHLCCGDLGGKPLVKPVTARPLVELAITLIDGWPTGYPLEVVHLPLSHGDRAPLMSTKFYEPMFELRGMGPHLSAGIAHHDATDDDQRQVLHWIERYTDQTVRIASWCGLGRLDLETANCLAARYRMLAAAA